MSRKETREIICDACGKRETMHSNQSGWIFVALGTPSPYGVSSSESTSWDFCEHCRMEKRQVFQSKLPQILKNILGWSDKDEKSNS